MSGRTVSQRLYSGFGDFSLRIWQNSTIKGITDGLVNLIPLVLISSFCIAISNIPIPALHDYLNGVTGGYWTLIANMLEFATRHIVGLAALLSVSHSLASQNKHIQKQEISAFIPMFTAFSSYVVLLVFNAVRYAAVPAGQMPDALFGIPGQDGVFLALFVAVVATKLYVLFSRFGQRYLWSRRRIVGSYSQLRYAVRAVGPMFFTLAGFVVLRLLVDWIYSFVDVQEQIGGFLTAPITEGSLLSLIGTCLLMQLLWFIGAHGSMSVQTFMGPMRDSTAAASAASASSGATAVSASAASVSSGAAAVPASAASVSSAATAVPAASASSTVSAASATTIVPVEALADPLTSAALFSNWDFYNTFVSMGGAGTTMALLIALLVFGSVNRGKRVGRISIFPAAFNINETMLFGIPIVFNPMFLIPFLLAPLLVTTVVYGAFSAGIVPPIISFVEWTTPIFLSGYLATGAVTGALLQLVCVGLAFAVYAPFVILSERTMERYQRELFAQFRVEASYAANNEHASVSNRRDEIGRMASEFITEINESIDSKRIPFFMMYQPKTDEQGRVAGAEALLRWEHPVYGFVPPDILIELGDEADLSVPIGRWITTSSLEELARWQKRGLAEVVLSINLNLRHILSDESFPEYLGSELTRLELDPALIELEITEHVAVTATRETSKVFARLRELGVRLSIDDMGMGYSSLNYISDFGASVVKLDFSLIDRVTTDVKQQEIVHSIINLAQQIDLVVIVEGVEELEQVETLIQLGCHYFQGYYFSRPLKAQDFLDYVDKHGTTCLKHEGKG